MTMTPVGIRCPEHASRKHPRTATLAGRRPGYRSSRTAIVTRTLVALNVGLYLVGVLQGNGLNEPGGHIYAQLWLDGPEVAGGGWWRLITAAFLQGSVLHLAFNMLALWWLGSRVEFALGRIRYLLLYAASGLAGSAGALLLSPDVVTVGASGAIFGLLGAGLVLEWRATGSLANSYLMLIAVNLLFTVAVPNISIGGHLGGLLAGILATALIVRAGWTFGRLDFTLPGIIGIGALSIAIAYLAL